MGQRHAEHGQRSEEKNGTEVRTSQKTPKDAELTELLGGFCQAVPLAGKRCARSPTSGHPCPRVPVIHGGAAQTDIPNTWLPNRKTAKSEGSKR